MRPRRLPERAACAWLLVCAAACGGGGGGGGDGGAPGAGGGGGAPGPTPELDVSSVVFAPSAVTAGEPLLVGDTVRNTGDADAGAFRVGVYLSLDDVFDAGDVLLGSRALPGLAAGAESTGGGPLPVPPATAEGSWRVLAVVDDLDAVDEGEEQDNARAADEALAVTGIDLAELSVTGCTLAEALVEAGQPIHVGDTLRNDGAASAGQFRVGLYLSVDLVVDPLDTLLGFRTVAQLAPGAEDAEVGEVTVPPATPAGVYRVLAWADDEEEVPESDELDNVLAADAPLTVVAPPLANLLPTAITFTPPAAQVGDELSVSESVLNAGLAAAATFQVGVYLSSDTLLDAGDVLLGLRTVPGLDVGLASGVQDAPLTIPAGLAAGTWYVGVRADATGLAPESDEADNDLFALGALELSVPQLPDLRPTSLTFSPSVVNPDLQQAVDFEESVENAGHVAAAQFRVGVYLATTPAISAADVLLHARQVVALDAGAASGAGASFQVPVGTPPGTYFVGVLVDDQGALDELSEGNNLLVAAGMLDVVDGGGGHAPNLVVEQVSTTASAVAAGGSFSVLTKVANVGDLSAAPFHVGVYLSDDDVVTTADTLVGERFQWNGLGVGFSSVVSGPVTVPAGLAPGTYHLGAIADHQSVVLESNELDNALVAGAQISVQ